MFLKYIICITSLFERMASFQKLCVFVRGVLILLTPTICPSRTENQVVATNKIVVVAHKIGELEKLPHDCQKAQSMMLQNKELTKLHELAYFLAALVIALIHYTIALVFNTVEVFAGLFFTAALMITFMYGRKLRRRCNLFIIIVEIDDSTTQEDIERFLSFYQRFKHLAEYFILDPKCEIDSRIKDLQYDLRSVVIDHIRYFWRVCVFGNKEQVMRLLPDTIVQ
jgi:hypothetical protein